MGPRKIYLLISLAVILVSCGGASLRNPSGEAQENSEVVVNIESRQALRPLSSLFLGFSHEKDMISRKYFDVKNKPLILLYQRLGSGIIRFGGNNVEKTTWDRHGKGNIKKVVAPKDLERLAEFIHATKWRIIYGVNLAKNTPENAADEAAYAAKVFGEYLVGFEIGNEPDLYSYHDLRPKTYSYEDFKTEWLTYYQAIRARVPNAVFTGPTSAANYKDFTIPFARDEGDKIKLLSHHYYRANGLDKSSTMDLLLDGDPNLKSKLQAIHQAADEAHIGYRISECNSYYNSGAPGVSNGFGTALWALDFMFENAIEGSEGINFHGGGNSTGYTPIANNEHDKVDGVRPMYYGMLTFAHMARGQLLKVKTSHHDPHFSIYATGSEEDDWVILSNKDRNKSYRATVNFDGLMSEVSSLLLTAPSLDSTSDYTFGGAAIQPDGSWLPARVNLGNNVDKIQLTVAPGTAILLHALKK